MKKIYANLLGSWKCLNDDPNSLIGDSKPAVWYEESAPVYAPIKREQENSYYQLDYVRIIYEGVEYRINPIFIQVVSE